VVFALNCSLALPLKQPGMKVIFSEGIFSFKSKQIECGSYDDVVTDQTGSSASALLSYGESEQPDRAEGVLHRITDLSSRVDLVLSCLLRMLEIAFIWPECKLFLTVSLIGGWSSTRINLTKLVYMLLLRDLAE
jgi:hypothetical protein